MALHTFDKRLLEFMYQLTLHQKLMAPKEMSQVITIQGKKVSERTIKRWLKWLKEHHYFTYYPSIRYERLGFTSYFIHLEDLNDKRLLEIIPYKVYLMNGHSIRNGRECFYAYYYVPNERAREFENFWKIAKNKNLFENFKIMKSKKIITLYSPYHEVLDSSGQITCKSKSINLYNSQLASVLNEKIKEGVHESIKENPLIIPLVLEYFKDYFSSKKIWHSINSKAGISAWSYIKDLRTINLKSDGRAINFIQNTVRRLYKNFNVYFRQVKVSYGPIYKAGNINLILFLGTQNKNRILDLIGDVLKGSLYVTCAFSENGGLFLDTLTNGEGVNNILSAIAKHRVSLNELSFINYGKSSEYWENKTKGWLKQHYHELFDPKTVSWKYDSEKYLRELNLLSVGGE